MGQTHVQRYTHPLLERIEKGEIDPSSIITHLLPIDAAPSAYETFKQKRDGCIKVVLKPWEEGGSGEQTGDAEVVGGKIKDFSTPESNPAKV